MVCTYTGVELSRPAGYPDGPLLSIGHADFHLKVQPNSSAKAEKQLTCGHLNLARKQQPRQTMWQQSCNVRPRGGRGRFPGRFNYVMPSCRRYISGLTAPGDNLISPLVIPPDVSIYMLHEVFRCYTRPFTTIFPEPVIAFSSNYALYASMSNRVMVHLEALAPRVEQCSIDEISCELKLIHTNVGK